MQFKKLSLISLLLIVLVGSCQIFPPKNIETIVREDYLKYWNLSPKGDYLIYGTPRGKGNFLIDLVTGQKYEYECSLHWWDDYLVGCYKPRNLSVIDVKTWLKTPLTQIDLTKETGIDKPEYVDELFVNQLLAQAELIYRPEWFTNTVYILAPEYQLNPDENYVILGLKQPDELLAQYPVIIVSDDSPASRSHEEAHSPDGLYYYKAFTVDLTIYRENTNEKVVEFFTEKAKIDVLGWAADSSGVYFTEYSVGFIGSGKPKAIYKLKVPNE